MNASGAAAAAPGATAGACPAGNAPASAGDVWLKASEAAFGAIAGASGCAGGAALLDDDDAFSANLLAKEAGLGLFGFPFGLPLGFGKGMLCFMAAALCLFNLFFLAFSKSCKSLVL